MTTAWLVAVMGALGSLLRWAISSAVQKLAGSAFPLGTLVVNLVGSAAIGLVMGVFLARGELDSRLRIGLTAGLLGGFTTYSSFAYETWSLLERRSYGAAALNVTITWLVCLAACGGGASLGRVVGR